MNRFGVSRPRIIAAALLLAVTSSGCSGGGSGSLAPALPTSPIIGQANAAAPVAAPALSGVAAPSPAPPTLTAPGAPAGVPPVPTAPGAAAPNAQPTAFVPGAPIVPAAPGVPAAPVAPAPPAPGAPAPPAGPAATIAPTPRPTIAYVAPPQPTAVPTQSPAPAQPFSIVNVAGVGSQPYPSGPFNAPVSSNPQFDSNSSTYLSNVMGGDYANFGKLQFATNVAGVTDNNTPIYVAHNSDPTYSIHCSYYSNCPLEGVQVHIPRGAVPAGRRGYTSFTDDGVNDQHLAVRNVDSQIETDMWLTPQPNGSGGTLNIGYGARYAFSSGGFNQPGGATAAGFSLSQGRVRAVDLLAGRIPYALFLTSPCENGHVYPASGDDGGGFVSGCPPIGAHLWLDSSPAEIANSGAPQDVKVLFNALHEFGGYIGDRCGSCSLHVALEGGVAYVAGGQANPWQQIADHYPGEQPSGPYSEYHIYASSGNIDLARHLHFVTN